MLKHELACAPCALQTYSTRTDGPPQDTAYNGMYTGRKEEGRGWKNSNISCILVSLKVPALTDGERSSDSRHQRKAVVRVLPRWCGFASEGSYKRSHEEKHLNEASPSSLAWLKKDPAAFRETWRFLANPSLCLCNATTSPGTVRSQIYNMYSSESTELNRFALDFQNCWHYFS